MPAFHLKLLNTPSKEKVDQISEVVDRLSTMMIDLRKIQENDHFQKIMNAFVADLFGAEEAIIMVLCINQKSNGRYFHDLVSEALCSYQEIMLDCEGDTAEASQHH